MPELDVDRFRERLVAERARVASALEYLHLENAGSMEDEGEKGGFGNHLAESASATYDRELDYSLEDNSEHVLAAIDAALKRIDDGTFGVCTNCGREIDAERLEGLPHATLCIDCRRLQDRG